MAEQIYTNALTTSDRVKARLGITVNSHDTQFNRIINAVTDWIESYCDRKFVSRTYTNEVYSVDGLNEQILFLRNSPVTAISALEYSNGTPSNKNWTSFLADDYEIVDDGRQGFVRIYATMPKGVNSIRATYTAGYAKDWTNAGAATHTIPADLTDLAERMVVKWFKRRDSDGRDSEGFEGNQITWEKEINEVDKATLYKYKRLPEFR